MFKCQVNHLMKTNPEEPVLFVFHYCFNAPVREENLTPQMIKQIQDTHRTTLPYNYPLLSTLEIN